MADKPDSQDICFVPTGDYRAFVREHAEPSPGAIVDTAGNHLGRHDGIEFFTIGQRRSLGITSRSPSYVVAIDAETSTVVVGGRDEIWSDSLSAEGVRYVSGTAPQGPTPVIAKFRYRSP